MHTVNYALKMSGKKRHLITGKPSDQQTAYDRDAAVFASSPHRKKIIKYSSLL
jgi:hypothetical protein